MSLLSRIDGRRRTGVILLTLVFLLTVVGCVLHGDHEDGDLVQHDFCAAMVVVELSLGLAVGLPLAGWASTERPLMVLLAPVRLLDPPPRATVLL